MRHASLAILNKDFLAPLPLGQRVCREQETASLALLGRREGTLRMFRKDLITLGMPQVQLRLFHRETLKTE